VFGLSIVRKEPLDALRSDPFIEQRRLLNKEAVTIFDVGAHIGDISKVYNDLFPKSTIYSFEPFPQSFAALQKNVQQHQNIHVINFGLADRRGSLPFHENTSSVTNSLLEPDAAADTTWGFGVVRSKGTAHCQFTTLDEFVAENGISFIDILKMDVQGAETQILDGAKKMLAFHRIGLIYTEIITMPTYKDQKPFWEILKRFDDAGMRLYNMYNFSLLGGRLRQIDAIFLA
jgi:FkbM family methyltransferase